MIVMGGGGTAGAADSAGVGVGRRGVRERGDERGVRADGDDAEVRQLHAEAADEAGLIAARLVLRRQIPVLLTRARDVANRDSLTSSVGSTSSRMAFAAVSSSLPSQSGPCSSCVRWFGWEASVSYGVVLAQRGVDFIWAPVGECHGISKTERRDLASRARPGTHHRREEVVERALHPRFAVSNHHGRLPEHLVLLLDVVRVPAFGLMASSFSVSVFTSCSYMASSFRRGS